MAEPTTLEDSGEATNVKMGDIERVKKEEKVPDGGEAEAEAEDWKIQAEAFKSEGEHVNTSVPIATITERERERVQALKYRQHCLYSMYSI